MKHTSAKQVSSDVSPWNYGGTWYDPERHWLIHIDGLEASGVRELDPEDVRATNETVQRVYRGCDRNCGRNPEGVSSVLDEWKIWAAKWYNEHIIRLPVYICADEFEDWMKPVFEEARNCYPSEHINHIMQDDIAKLLLVAEHIGWGELDPHPLPYSKVELAKLLGVSQDIL